MKRKERPFPLFALFIVVMLLLIGVGLFLMIYGSLHNPGTSPVMPGSGLMAMRSPNASYEEALHLPVHAARDAGNAPGIFLPPAAD